jgi:hypothetical protein
MALLVLGDLLEADLPVADWGISPAGRLSGHVHMDPRTSAPQALGVWERAEAVQKWAELLGAPLEELRMKSDQVWAVRVTLRGVCVQVMANVPYDWPEYPAPGSAIPDQPGYVVGECEHRVARSEWQAGLRTCERCAFGVAEELRESAGEEPL